MNQAEHQPESDRPEEGSFGQLNDLAQTIISRTQESRSMVSPWVQRALAEQSSISTAGPGSARRLQPMLTGPGLGSMLRKVQLRTEGSRVWRPDVGSLQPELVDRFAGAIVRRFPAVAGKYETQPLQMASTGETNMVLPGDLPPADESETAIAQPEQPWPNLVDLQRAVEARSSWSRSPDRPAPVQPQIQRTTAEPSRPSPPLHPAGPRPQLFSRVEEISPSGRRSTRLRSSGTPPEPAPVDEPSTAASTEKRTPEVPVLKPAEDAVKSAPSADQPNAEGAVQPLPDRPKASPIQRQVTEEPREQTPHRQTEMPGVEPMPPKGDDLPDIEPFDRDLAAGQTERGPVSSPPIEPAQPPVQRQSEAAQPKPDHIAPAQSEAGTSGSPPDWLQSGAEPGPPIQSSQPPVQRQSEVTRPDREFASKQVGSAGELASRPGQSDPDQTEAAKPAQRELDVSRSPIQRRPGSLPEPDKPERSSPKMAAPSPQESAEGAVEDRSVSRLESKPVEWPTQASVQRQETERVDETDQQVDHERALQAEPPDGPFWPGSSADPGIVADRAERRSEPKAPTQSSLPPVQRQTRADRPPPSQPRPTERGPIESSSPAAPGIAAPRADGRAEDGSRTVREPHSTTAEASLPVVQRRPEPAAKPAVELDSGLQEQLLARAASRVELPLIEPLRPERPLARIKPMLQTQPAQIRVQTRFEDSDIERRDIEPLSSGRSRAQTMPGWPVQPRVMARREAATVRPDSTGAGPAAVELPLPRLGPSGSAVRASPAGSEMILRAEEPVAATGGTETTGDEQAEPDLDLDQLAKQVYPHVRRLLQIERERRAGLSTLHDL